MRPAILRMAAVALVVSGCAGEDSDSKTPPVGSEWDCVLPDAPEPDSSDQVGCWSDFERLASDPLDASIPGAESAKTIIDRTDDGALYFINSERYPIHYEFASAFLSGDGLPIVPDLGSFNTTEYYAPERRFLLGAVTWYTEPGVFVYELAPYDTSDAEMIAEAFRAIVANSYFGEELLFHPTSMAIEEVAKTLPDDIPIITTDELFAGITYQPLNLGTSMGQLRFYTSDEVEDYVNYREIVVLDKIPNDISVVAGTITGEFQTPLAHINVLAQNRGTPNMALRGAFEDDTLRGLEGKWVELTVDALEWSIREVTETEADAWWDANRPEPLEVTPMDTSVEGIWGCEEILDASLSVEEAIPLRIPAFGGKVSHMAAMTRIGADVPMPKCLGIPVYWYDQHMRTHGLWDVYAEYTTRPEWLDPRTRADLLEDLKDQIEDAPMSAELLAEIRSIIDEDFDRIKMRFRSSTNAEDLGGFSGAGLYSSKSGKWDEDGEDIEDAITDVWASVWNPRAWEEREYYGISHTGVGMAILVNPTYDDEQANGVAITANIFDTSGLEPAFYINVQKGEESVVLPDEGVTTDQILYYYDSPGQPVVYIRRSNLVPDGETVMSNAELYELGTALSAIHAHFLPAYGRSGGFYAMDIEFKITEDGRLEIKQARPYPGWQAD
jgi:hypothetical protein